MRHLDPAMLAAFIAVAETGSFSLAAKRLKRTQSTVSGQMTRLEAALGVRLFHRTTRSVRMSEDGARLVKDAKRLLEVEAAIIDRFSTAPLSGGIRLGASDDLASGHALAAIAERFCRRHPSVRLSVTIGNGPELVRKARSGGLDMAIAKMVAPDASAGRPLWEDRVVLAQAAIFDGRAEELPLALFPEPCVYRNAALTWLASQDRAWRIAYETPSFHGLLAAVAEGYAVAPLAESVVRRTPNLVQSTAPNDVLGTYTVTLTRGSRQNPAASYLSEQLIAHFGSAGS